MANRPKPKADPDRADERPALPASEAPRRAPARERTRVEGAYFLGGAWYAADGSPLTAVEAQQAHRAMDRRAAELRERALGGA